MQEPNVLYLKTYKTQFTDALTNKSSSRTQSRPHFSSPYVFQVGARLSAVPSDTCGPEKRKRGSGSGCNRSGDANLPVWVLRIIVASLSSGGWSHRSGEVKPRFTIVVLRLCSLSHSFDSFHFHYNLVLSTSPSPAFHSLSPCFCQPSLSISRFLPWDKYEYSLARLNQRQRRAGGRVCGIALAGVMRPNPLLTGPCLNSSCLSHPVIE